MQQELYRRYSVKMSMMFCLISARILLIYESIPLPLKPMIKQRLSVRKTHRLHNRLIRDKSCRHSKRTLHLHISFDTYYVEMQLMSHGLYRLLRITLQRQQPNAGHLSVN